ncbi:MAG TPA: hypothetical protein VN729_11905 [Ktedonobacteraceae bacterium]|nr:hypothetical protein [Ktedonobacteraceae bacterium]
MQCNRCGATLPTSASTCPYCANPTPHNVGSSPSSYGYMTNSFFADGNTGQGTIEVFWCQDSACTHGGLSWVRPFSVTTN